MQVVIQPNLVDLNGETFREFSEQRQQWEIMDSFINPGPIQSALAAKISEVWQMHGRIGWWGAVPGGGMSWQHCPAECGRTRLRYTAKDTIELGSI